MVFQPFLFAFAAMSRRKTLQFLLVHGSVHPLALFHIATGEDADVEHAVAVITTMRDGDVIVVDHAVVRRVETDPAVSMIDFHPSMRGALNPT